MFIITSTWSSGFIDAIFCTVCSFGERARPPGTPRATGGARARKRFVMKILSELKEVGQVEQDDVDQEMEDRWLGSRLRQARRKRGMSIRELGGKAALSTGMVSQIERGLSTPSLRSLRLLANALEVPVSYFFADTPASKKERRHIVRSHQRKRLMVPSTGVVQEIISPEGPGSIEIYEIQLEPDATSDGEMYSHDGEKAGLVLSGTLGLRLEDEDYLLEPGDSFRFPSTMPHRMSNPTSGKVHLIWVVLGQTRSIDDGK